MLAPPIAEGEELRRLLEEYKGVTARLVSSHDTLRAQLAEVRLELAAKNRELERRKRLEALGRVAAGVAHEFRNPLGGIRLTIDALRRERAGERARGTSSPSADPAADAERLERLDRIARAVEHLDRIVADLMTFTRDQPLDLRPNPAGELVDAAAEIAFSGVSDAIPAIDRAGDPELAIPCDRHAFVQVLVNLFDNARRAMVGNGALARTGPHLAVAWGRHGGRLWMEVADRGPGIPRGEEERIFHPFHSLREGGTGLGLAIVHSRIEAHGGEIAVVEDRRSTQPGFDGARFRIELPGSAERSSPPRGLQ
jgi:signal transduction histidine kinase